MCPSPVLDPASEINANCTNEEICLHLEKMMSGSSHPSNVTTDVNPYKFEPNNLPDGIWYLIRSKENSDTGHGSWKAKGEACEVFSNASIIGWMTTLEFYEVQVPNERKTDWVMQDFRITEKRPNENTEAKEAGSLCRVYQQSPDHERLQHASVAGASRETQSLLTELMFPSDSDGTRQVSTSEPQANVDVKIEELVDTERLPNHHIEYLPEIDYLPEGDYLELLDLDNPASPSSSSESSSCVTMSSDECFDSALLRDLESENIQDSTKKDAGYKFRVSAANEVVIPPAITGSRICIRSSGSPTEETFKTDSSLPGSAIRNRNLDNKVLKLVVGSDRTDYRDEDPPSSYQHNPAISSHGHKAAPDGKERAPIGRMKRLKKKYFCFMPF